MGVGDVNMKCAGDVAKGYVLAWDVAAGYPEPDPGQR